MGVFLIVFVVARELSGNILQEYFAELFYLPD
jgi:hypothetical protein